MLRMYDAKNCEWVGEGTLLWKNVCYLNKRLTIMCLAKKKINDIIMNNGTFIRIIQTTKNKNKTKKQSSMKLEGKKWTKSLNIKKTFAFFALIKNYKKKFFKWSRDQADTLRYAIPKKCKEEQEKQTLGLLAFTAGKIQRHYCFSATPVALQNQQKPSSTW